MRSALVLWWNRAFWRQERCGDGLGSRGMGINCWSWALTRLLSGLQGCLVPPGIPVSTPGRESILLVVDAVMDLPLKGEKPFEFHGIQIGNGNVANLGPGLVLERIVVQELASQEKGNRQHAIDLATARGIDAGSREHPHPAGQVVQTQEDGGTGETGRRQDLEDVFPELRGYRQSWGDASRQVNIC